MKSYKKINIAFALTSFVLLVLLAGIVLGQSKSVRASTSLTLNSTNTQNPFSTTTANFMQAGTGTTTLPVFTMGADQVNFNIMFIASTSTSTLAWRYEYSPNFVDWFSEDVTLATNSTSTPSVRTFAENTWVFSTSTAASATNNTGFKHVRLLNVASPYTRIVFYIPVGSPPGAVWAQSITKTSPSI